MIILNDTDYPSPPSDWEAVHTVDSHRIFIGEGLEINDSELQASMASAVGKGHILIEDKPTLPLRRPWYTELIDLRARYFELLKAFRARYPKVHIGPYDPLYYFGSMATNKQVEHTDYLNASRCMRELYGPDVADILYLDLRPRYTDEYEQQQYMLRLIHYAANSSYRCKLYGIITNRFPNGKPVTRAYWEEYSTIHKALDGVVFRDKLNEPHFTDILLQPGYIGPNMDSRPLEVVTNFRTQPLSALPNTENGASITPASNGSDGFTVQQTSGAFSTRAYKQCLNALRLEKDQEFQLTVRISATSGDFTKPNIALVGGGSIQSLDSSDITRVCNFPGLYTVRFKVTETYDQFNVLVGIGVDVRAGRERVISTALKSITVDQVQLEPLDKGNTSANPILLSPRSDHPQCPASVALNIRRTGEVILDPHDDHRNLLWFGDNGSRSHPTSPQRLVQRMMMDNYAVAGEWPSLNQGADAGTYRMDEITLTKINTLRDGVMAIHPRAIRPNTLVLQRGMADLMNGTTGDALFTTVKAIIEQALGSQGFQQVYVVLLPPLSSQSSSIQTQANQYHSRMDTEYRSNNRVTLIDVRSILGTSGDSNVLKSEYVIPSTLPSTSTPNPNYDGYTANSMGLLALQEKIAEIISSRGPKPWDGYSSVEVTSIAEDAVDGIQVGDVLWVDPLVYSDSKCRQSSGYRATGSSDGQVTVINGSPGEYYIKVFLYANGDYRGPIVKRVTVKDQYNRITLPGIYMVTSPIASIVNIDGDNILRQNQKDVVITLVNMPTWASNVSIALNGTALENIRYVSGSNTATVDIPSTLPVTATGELTVDYTE